MTLGDIIKEYLEEHTVNEFLKDSGISKAYTYNLINNKGTSGAAPTPTIDTINKVAKGVHSDFDTILRKLDPDTVVTTNKKDENAKIKVHIGHSKQSNNFYTIDMYKDGTIKIVPKNELQRLMDLSNNESIQKLIAAAKKCTPQQIAIATDMLNAFTKEQ